MVKKFLRNYFTFSKKERNGLLVLLLMMTFVVMWPTIYKAIYKDEVLSLSIEHVPPDSLQNLVQATIENLERGASYYDSDSYSQYSSDPASLEQDKAILFPFDPNTLDADGWKLLGVPEKNISTILKYRAKGGKFYKKEDLKRIYGFRESDYQRLEKYISLTENASVPYEKRSMEDYNTAESPPALHELNSMDSLALVSLRGIGPVLSSRIIKYRNKLGGYIAIEQLKEVYGLQPESFDMLKAQVLVDASLVHKININNIAATDLRLHPYFKNPLASMIINFREQHGLFKTAEDLKQVELVNDSVFQKIVPYLEF